MLCPSTNAYRPAPLGGHPAVRTLRFAPMWLAVRGGMKRGAYSGIVNMAVRDWSSRRLAAFWVMLLLVVLLIPRLVELSIYIDPVPTGLLFTVGGVRLLAIVFGASVTWKWIGARKKISN